MIKWRKDGAIYTYILYFCSSMISDKWRTKARGTWTDKPRKSNMMISNVLYKLYWRLTANRWQIGFPQTSLEQIAGGG